MFNAFPCRGALPRTLLVSRFSPFAFRFFYLHAFLPLLVIFCACCPNLVYLQRYESRGSLVTCNDMRFLHPFNGRMPGPIILLASPGLRSWVYVCFPYAGSTSACMICTSSTCLLLVVPLVSHFLSYCFPRQWSPTCFQYAAVTLGPCVCACFKLVSTGSHTCLPLVSFLSLIGPMHSLLAPWAA